MDTMQVAERVDDYLKHYDVAAIVLLNQDNPLLGIADFDPDTGLYQGVPVRLSDSAQRVVEQLNRLGHDVVVVGYRDNVYLSPSYSNGELHGTHTVELRHSKPR